MHDQLTNLSVKWREVFTTGNRSEAHAIRQPWRCRRASKEPRCPPTCRFGHYSLLHNRPPLLVALPRGIHGNGMAVGGLQGQAHRLLPSFFTSICNSMVEKSTRTGCNEIMTFEPMSSLPLSSSSCSSSSSPKLESESNVTVKLAKYKTFVELEMYVHHNAAAAVARGSYCIKMVFLNHQRYAPKPCVS